MTNSELLDELNEAITLVEEAKAKVDKVAKEMKVWWHYTTYGRYGFDTILSSDNPLPRSLFDMRAEVKALIEEKKEEEKEDLSGYWGD